MAPRTTVGLSRRALAIEQGEGRTVYVFSLKASEILELAAISRVSRDDGGNLITLGTGRQHWSTIHVADLARFFRRVLESDSARGRYVVGDGLQPTLAELTEAAAAAAGAPGAVPGSDGEARARLGDYFAEVLLLDQGTSAAKARDQLDWSPTHPGLVDEFRHGSYSSEAKAV